MKQVKIVGNRLATAFVAVILLACLPLQAQTPTEWKKLKGDVTLYMCNDMGRNGHGVCAGCGRHSSF